MGVPWRAGIATVAALLLIAGCGTERGGGTVDADEGTQQGGTLSPGISREEERDGPPEALMLAFPDTSPSWATPEEKELILTWVEDLVLPAAADGAMLVSATPVTGRTVEDYDPIVSYSFAWTGDGSLRERDLAAITPRFMDRLRDGLAGAPAERTDMLGVLDVIDRARGDLEVPVHAVVLGDGVTTSEGCDLLHEYTQGEHRSVDEMAEVCAALVEGVDLADVSLTVLGGGRAASGNLPEDVTDSAEAVLSTVVERLGGCLHWVFDPTMVGPEVVAGGC